MRLRTLPAALTLVWVATYAWAQVPVVTTIDSAGDVGRWSDVVLRADGRGVVAYTDATNGTLKVASCGDVGCTSALLTTIDDDGPFEDVSVAIAFPGHPVVAYQHVPTASVRYAYCQDPNCLTATVVTIEDLPSLVDGTGIVIGVDTMPLIVYGQASGGTLRVAHCEDLNCAFRTITPYPDTVGVGPDSAVTIGSDGLAVFGSQHGPDLRVGHCTNVECTSATFTRLVGFSSPTFSQIYRDPDFALGSDGRVVLAFGYSEQGFPTPPPFFDTRIRRCADVVCSSLVEQQSIAWFNSEPSVGMAPGNRPLVSHYGAWTTPDNRLKVKRCTEASCPEPSPVVIIDAPNIGLWHAMTTGPLGTALLSYYDEVNDDLKVAWVGTLPEISIGNVAITEGDSGQGLAQLPVTLSGAENATVDFATVNGTATAGADYVATAGTLTFAPGTTTQFVPVPVLGDLIPENDETFRLVLTNGQGATVVDPEAVVTIVDNEARLLISNESIVEGDTGTQDVVFTVSLDNVSASTITVAFATQGTSATSGVDFLPASGTLTFPPGTTARTVAVSVIGDTLVEFQEGFQVVLSNPQGGLIEDNVGNGVIFNDDEARVSITDQALAEGDSGSQPLTFTVSVDNPSATVMTVAFATEPITATSGVDYAPASGTVTFQPGTTSRPVAVAVNGDVLVEPDETFRVQLSNATGSLIEDGEGIGAIADDDTARLSISDGAATEGDTGSQELLFTISVDHASATAMTVDFATEEITATSGVDFVSASGTVTFPPGTTTGIVAVAVNGDYLLEPDETFRIALSNAQGSLIQDAEGTGTIVNDDAPEAPLFGELRHGMSVAGDLTVNPGPAADTDDFRMFQAPYASYEIVVDAASGETVPLTVERRTLGGTVLQTGVPVGTGAARSLRWRVAGTEPITDERIRITGACGTACGPDDAYRARAFETTLSAARFNNAGTQTTVLVIQNPGTEPVSLSISFWAPDGTLLAAHEPAAPLAPSGALVLNTSTIPGAGGAGGSLTVAHDAPYGRLVGKAVAVEPSTGLSFDTPLEPKPH